MTPLDFGDNITFSQRVDLSVPGMAQDCAECHVGGGPMEYVNNPNMDDRVSLRDISTTDVNGFGTITASNYTAFNYFIDTWDVDNDGVLTEVQYNDWNITGVLEMDCLLCHLNGYDYDARTAMLRDSKFDASRAVGAGIAAPNTAAWGDADYGKVIYNDLVEYLGSGAELSNTVRMAISASPPSENCAFCHFNFPGVDWKKRGDNWKKENDAHWVVGCMGCHEGKVGSEIGTSGDPNSPALGQCDPAKGHEPYSGLQNAKDDSIKTCEDCHLRAGYDSGLSTYSPDYGAPDPTGKHQAYGLLGEICQSGVSGGTPNASHLDVVHCTACHVQKIADEDWNTGGAVVDATGVDAVGRQADHENDHVLRSMRDDEGETNLAYQWRDGKVVPTGVLTTLYWRDANGALDINNDGNVGGQDVPLTTHVTAVNEVMGWSAMSHDTSGLMDIAAFDARIEALRLGLPWLNGNSGTPDIRLCAMAVPFVVTHNVSPAVEALGHACTDCHSSGSQGLWNEDYRLQGDDMNLTIRGYSQGSPQAIRMSPGGDFHPNLAGKTGTHIVVDVLADDNLTDVNRSQVLYADSASVTAVDTTSGITYTSRTEWVDYLNSIPTAYPDIATPTYPTAVISVAGYSGSPYLRGYGIGCDVTAPGVDPDDPSTWGSCQMVWDMIDCNLYEPLTFTATDVGPGATYTWNFADGGGQESGISVDHTFNLLGVCNVILTVQDMWGMVDQKMIKVNVQRP
jgi:hypothetical protein